MLKTSILLVLVVGYVVEGEVDSSINEEKRALNVQQLTGMKRLLKDLDSGVLTTCSIVFFAEQVRYEVAEENCKNFNIGSGRAEKGNLVTVNNAEKNKDLTLLLEMAYPEAEQPESKWTATKWVWAGLQKIHNNNLEAVNGKAAKKQSEYRASDWAWADKSNPTDFAMWPTGKKDRQPDQAISKFGEKGCDEEPVCRQNQMRINHAGSWDDAWKFKTHPYACDYRGKYVLSNEHLSWEDAKVACEDAGLHLAKVRSENEVDEMMDAMRYFLGPRDVSLKTYDSGNWLWLAGNDINEEGDWVWSDGTPAENWNMPWRRKAGKDNAKFLAGTVGGQDAMSFSRWGEFDDSFTTIRERPFACQCPDS